MIALNKKRRMLENAGVLHSLERRSDVLVVQFEIVAVCMRKI